MAVPPLRHYIREIEDALRHSGGTHRFEDVEHGVESGRMQYWATPRSVMITELCEYPQHKALHCFLFAGNQADLEAMIPKLEEWGQSQGCVRVTFQGRKGWERSPVIREAGYEPTQVVFEKLLSGRVI